MIDQIDIPLDALAAEIPSTPISVAVSNPRPNRKPTRYICQLRLIRRKVLPNNQLIMPPPVATSSLTLPPLFHVRKLRQTLRKITRLINAISNKNSADTAVPITLPVSCSQLICWPKAVAVAAIAAEASTTIDEWPNENQAPTAKGRRPCCIILRVTLSIAAIWSASTAWRNPYPQASRLAAISAPLSPNACQAQPQASRFATTSPNTSAAARGCWRKIVTIMMIPCEPASGLRPRPPDQTRWPHLRQGAAAETAE